MRARGPAGRRLRLRGRATTTGDVSLTVTRDFGGERLHEGIEEHATEGDTVMRLLTRNYEVDTRYGGGFVQEIDGVGGGREDGRRVDWFYYVNGIEAPIGAAERRVAAGERVWWDHHDWERGAAGPGRGRLVPGAVRSGSRASGSRSGSCASGTPSDRATRSPSGSRTRA